MNVNLHIERVVLDGIDLAAGETGLLHNTVISQLTAILASQLRGESRLAFEDRADYRAGSSIRLGSTLEATSFGPQLANAIYANTLQRYLGPSAASRGES
jgi:hypothetical protein